MNIREYRKQLGITTAEAARQLNVDQSTFNRWERGENTPDGRHLMRVIKWSKGKISAEEIIEYRGAQ